MRAQIVSVVAMIGRAVADTLTAWRKELSALFLNLICDGSSSHVGKIVLEFGASGTVARYVMRHGERTIGSISQGSAEAPRQFASMIEKAFLPRGIPRDMVV